MEVYQTYRNSDMTEGRGPMVADLCFSSKFDACEYVEKQPHPYDHNKWHKATDDRISFGMWEVRTVNVMPDLKTAMDFKNGEIKKQALAKLTDIERKALGF